MYTFFDSRYSLSACVFKRVTAGVAALLVAFGVTSVLGSERAVADSTRGYSLTDTATGAPLTGAGANPAGSNTFSSLAVAVDACPKESACTVTVDTNDSNTGQTTIASKSITLTSSPGNRHTLTSASTSRMIIVNATGTLTLENIIIKASGGIRVDGKAKLSNGTRITGRPSGSSGAV